LSFPANVQVGDVVTVTCAENFGQSSLTVSGLGGTWSVVAGPSAEGSNPAWLILAGQVVTSGKTIAVSGTSGSLKCGAQEWSGVTTAVDAQASVNFQASSVQVGVTTGNANDLLLEVAGNNAGARGTPSGPPWTALNNGGISGLTADPVFRVVNSTGTYEAGDSFSFSVNAGAAIVALKGG
jgi:hypothetical protein